MRAGIPYATLRVFEHSGRISLISFVKLMQALGREAPLVEATAPIASTYTSIDEVTAKKPQRKRGNIT